MGEVEKIEDPPMRIKKTRKTQQKKNREQFNKEAKEFYELQLKGWTLREIGREYGVSHKMVWYRLQQYLPPLIEEDARKWRAQQIQKLALIEGKLWEAIEASHYKIDNGGVVMHDGRPLPDWDPFFKAVDRIIKIYERRSKLLGLDVPPRVDITVTEGDARDAELAEMINIGRARGALRDIESS